MKQLVEIENMRVRAYRYQKLLRLLQVMEPEDLLADIIPVFATMRYQESHKTLRQHDYKAKTFGALANRYVNNDNVAWKDLTPDQTTG